MVGELQRAAMRFERSKVTLRVPSRVLAIRLITVNTKVVSSYGVRGRPCSQGIRTIHGCTWVATLDAISPSGQTVGMSNMKMRHGWGGGT